MTRYVNSRNGLLYLNPQHIISIELKQKTTSGITGNVQVYRVVATMVTGQEHEIALIERGTTQEDASAIMQELMDEFMR